ncbi:membrane-spanning 4-domains subfamily A member 13 isoform X1 [Mesocricetus auratus]|uniref:Membrane-spanning 4-domains subfamily A member 13 isoform X1 n=1 Tax=Mesocricetus auratus TaxID=10036 RepID=A0A1U7Q2L3_MESAU|nr:membrane-spanning 4-domains subfamily A member 13 isoform X1 [Mesocricetus auratus]XP_040603300.1 membrane-spanning 4-domains subfamily A member 13 isoform X1 [Mesocricetus auratus]
MGCGNSKISSSNIVILGVIQIMIGIYHVLMWYFLLLLYMGQIKGVFGSYEPLTYKMGTALWGLTFIISGAFTIKAANYQSRYMLVCALSLNILCIIVTIIAASLTIVELAHFRSVSYKNYGQAKLGREVSRILLFSYPLEFGIALTYSICSCSHLGRRQESNLESVTEVMSNSF